MDGVRQVQSEPDPLPIWSLTRCFSRTIVAFGLSASTLLLRPHVSAQDRLLPVFRFEQVSGLTTDEVRSPVVRDDQGYVWIGTVNGLNRFDGYSIRQYRNDPVDPSSLSSNVVREVFLDSKGRLWVGTIDSGLSLYDPVHDRFINFVPRQGDSSWYSAKFIYSISEDRSGNLWLATIYGGMVHVELPPENACAPDSLSSKVHFTTYELGTSRNAACGVLDQEDGKVLVGSDSGIIVLDLVTHAISRLHLPGKIGRRLDSLEINCMLVDSRGDSWVGTFSEGLFRIDWRRKEVTNFRHRDGDDSSIKADVIFDIVDDLRGNLWIGSEGGVDLFSPASGRCTPYLTIGSKLHLPTGWMWLTIDRSGVLWVGMMNGAYSLTPKSRRFPLYSLRDKDRVSPISFSNVILDDHGSCWCMSAKGILHSIDFATGKVVKRIDVFRGKHPSAEPCVSFIDRRGIYWHGTYGLGLFRVDLRNGQVRNYGAEAGLGANRVVVGIAQGDGDTLWTACEYFGAKKFYPPSGRFLDVPGLSAGNVWKVMKDHRGMVWMGSEHDGITILDVSTGAMERLRHKSADPRSLSSNRVLSLHEDTLGRIWVGAGNVINLWDPATHTFTRYSNPEFTKAPSTDILGSDHSGRLWANFFGVGLSVFDPSSGLFTNYDESDGVSADRPMVNLPDGRVILPGWAGINVFRPDGIESRRSPPPLVITRMSVNDRPTTPPRLTDSSTILNLPYSRNVLEFEFAAIDVEAPRLVEYQYRLDGLEKDWVKPTDRRYVRYPGLSPGRYVFRVKATSVRNEWTDREITLAIIIAPPWWRSTWAYAAYGFLCIAFLFGVYRLRVRQVQLRQEADMERFQAKHLAEVDRLKSRFFSNISHEFRTPLTLILGPADQGLESNSQETKDQKFHLIKDSANRLLGLVNQLLDFSRLESGMMRLQVSRSDIVQFLRRVVMSFESLAERKKISLQFHSDGVSAECYFDGDKLEKIVSNLVSNALKFTAQGGKVRVTVEKDTSNRAQPQHRLSRITVSDTGVGIPPDHLPHIFDRFYRVDETHTSEGTGIGLALTKELVELHHGTIRVESTPGKGSEFTVVLPFDKEAYRTEEIRETVAETGELEAVEVPTTLAEPGTAPAAPTIQGKPIALVVEDNADLRVYIKEHLQPDYAVHEAGNGKEGFDRATDIVPDIVISDVMMPEMDGMELCRALKQDVRTSHVPVILLTARAGTESKIEGLELGADDYVTKPFDLKELVARVRNLIEQRRQLRRKFSAGVVLKPGEVAVTSLDDALLKKVMESVEKNIGNETFGVEQLARQVSLSRRHLDRKLRGLTNLSPNSFIRYIRLQRAHKLLENRAGSVTEIAYQVGFGSSAYFTRCFHKRFGYSPSEISNRNT